MKKRDIIAQIQANSDRLEIVRAMVDHAEGRLRFSSRDAMLTYLFSLLPERTPQFDYRQRSFPFMGKRQK